MADKKNIDSMNEYAGEAPEKKAADDLGSDKFHQGEEKIEEVDIPALRNGIKAERVGKEDIYGSKEEKQNAFIASLGRKKETSGDEEDGSQEYAEAGMSRGRKAGLAIVVLIIIGSLAGFGYWLWSKKKYEAAKEAESRSIAQLYEESVQNKASEQKTEEKIEPVEEIEPAEVSVSVLNEGAAAGSAGKTKDLLSEKGYAKATADNGEADSTGASIYYSEDKFKLSAEAIKEILAENKTQAEVKKAETSQQKSADVVVVLGK